MDYINHWSALSLECRDWLFEASTMEICTQGIKWDLLYILQMSKPWTFQELATKAYDMEVTIAKFKRNVKFSKNSSKEAMSIFKVE